MNLNPYMMERLAKQRMAELISAAERHRLVRGATKHPQRPARDLNNTSVRMRPEAARAPASHIDHNGFAAVQ